MRCERGELLRDVSWHLEAEPQEFIQLPTEDDDRDATRESRDDRVGEELEQPPHAQRAEKDQHDARHHRGKSQAAVSIDCDHGKEDGHERACRSRDLKPRAAQHRHDETRDDPGPKSLLRRDAGSDAEANRERKRDESDR